MCLRRTQNVVGQSTTNTSTEVQVVEKVSLTLDIFSSKFLLQVSIVVLGDLVFCCTVHTYFYLFVYLQKVVPL